MNQVQNRTDRKTTRRLVITFAFFLVVATVIVGRLADYQLKMHEYYQSKVLNQLTIQTEVTPERGNILDTNGNLLATNKTVYNVILSPADIIRVINDDTEKNSDTKSDNDVYYTYDDEEYGIHFSGDRLDELIAEVLSKYLEVDRTLIIEKAAKELSRNYKVTVATSDGLEQMIIFGSGAYRLPARALLEDVLRVENRVREIVEQYNIDAENTKFLRTIRDKMEELEMGIEE